MVVNILIDSNFHIQNAKERTNTGLGHDDNLNFCDRDSVRV